MSRSKYWQEIISMQKSGMFPEAKVQIESYSSNLSEAELAECVGNQCFQERKFQEASKYYERAITLEPDHIIARYQYLAGVSEHKSKNYKDAFVRFVNAIESEPEFVDPYVELGAMLLTIGDAEGAYKCFSDALSLEKNELGNYFNIVAALKDLTKEKPEKYSELLKLAVKDYENAKLRLQPIAKDHIHEMPRA